MRRKTGLLLLALAALFAVACGGESGVRKSPVHRMAEEENARGVASVESRRYEEALGSFRNALRLSRSIDDPEGQALALLNIVRACRLSDRSSESCGHVSEHIEEGLRLVHAGPLYQEFLMEKIHQEAMAGRLAPALETSKRLLAMGDMAPERRGRAANLQAALELRQGDAVSAQKTAEGALRINRDAGSRVEEANSLRLLGEISLAVDAASQARVHCDEALALDRDLGHGLGVGNDLLCLSRAAQALGEPDEAATFLSRASSVAETSGIPELIRSVRAMKGNVP